MAMKPVIWIKELWKWLVTSKYVLALEAEVERLRAENRALMNSVLGIAGVPPVIAQNEPTAAVNPQVKTNGQAAGAAPAVPVRKRSWQQVNRALEIEAAKKKEPGQV
ncbi:MAG TPA: hypothetical protein VIY69_13575 [Candidatus Acidoferrales bacterium]